MNDTITTKSMSSNIADVKEDFVLDEKPMSRLVFHAQIHEKGIRGKIIRQRRSSKKDSWDPEKAIHILTLGKNETINIELSTQAVKKLDSAIKKLQYFLKQEGIQSGEKQYAIIDPERVRFTDGNINTYIKKIINAGYDEKFWENLVETNPSLATKLAYAKVQINRKQVLKELKSRLQSNKFSETSGDNSWQKWIYKNNWLFGVNYKKPFEKMKINVQGIMPDYLFPTIDGFVDILEIKLPRDEVIAKDRNHSGAWKWMPKINEAIGQIVNYLGEIDRLRLEIERNIKVKYKYEVSLLKPRAYILTGDSSQWPHEKKEGLRKMNHALHGIEILTYKDLLDRGESYCDSTK